MIDSQHDRNTSDDDDPRSATNDDPSTQDTQPLDRADLELRMAAELLQQAQHRLYRAMTFKPRLEQTLGLEPMRLFAQAEALLAEIGA